MKQNDEMKMFGRRYKMPIGIVRKLWAAYSRKPKGYKPVLSVDSDAKTSKSIAYGYLTGICYFAPSDLSGYDVCTSSSPECRRACLAFSGHGGIIKPGKQHSDVTIRRIAKTLRYYHENKRFMASFKHDCFKLMRSAARKKLIPVVRPNGTSDLPKMAHEIAAEFTPWLQLYDYTKHAKPWLRTKENYHLTFSYSGHNMAECLEALSHGINVTVVYARASQMPETYWGFPTIDGDTHDLRFLDKPGHVIMLRSKGNSHSKDTSGSFIILNNTLQISDRSPAADRKPMPGLNGLYDHLYPRTDCAMAVTA